MTPFDPDDRRRLEEAEAVLARSLQEIDPSPGLLARVRGDFESRRAWTLWPAAPLWRVAVSSALLALVAAGLVLVRRPPASAVPSASLATSISPLPRETPLATPLERDPIEPASPHPLRRPKTPLRTTSPLAPPRFEVLVPAGRAALQEAALRQLAALAAEGGPSPRALHEAGEPTRDLAEPLSSDLVPVFAGDSRSDS